MKSIQDIKNLKNKKVLVRVDFNVPVGSNGTLDGKEDWRIKATFPTIEYLLKRDAKIILISHLGRPGQYQASSTKHQAYSLMPVAKRLEKLLNHKIIFLNNSIGDKVEKQVEKMQAGEIILLENLRFYKGEEENNQEFAQKLANLADIYINNAFSVSHRAHASVSAITKFLPSYAGLLLEKEIKTLSNAINNPKRPLTIIIGGAKVKTKVPVIEYLMNKVDYIIVGGVVANIILKAEGINVGKSLLNGMDMAEIKKIKFKRDKLYVPKDVVVYNVENNQKSLVAVEKVGSNKILDIGTESVKLFSKIISDSSVIIWNGPMGMFEDKNFAFGTRKIAQAMAKTQGYTIIGGGETMAALNQFSYLDNINYICTGGGAMLEFLAGKKLAGIEALK